MESRVSMVRGSQQGHSPQQEAVAPPSDACDSTEPVKTVSRGNRYGLVLILGYGLFKSLMDLTYTTAASTITNSYIVVNNLTFSILSSFFIILTAALLTFCCWRRPQTRLDAAALVSLVCLATVNLLPATGLLSVFPGRTAGIFLAAVYGVTAIAANTAWLAPFAPLGPRRCLASLSLGMLIGSGGAALAARLPSAEQPWCLLGLGIASAVLYGLHMRLRKSYGGTSLDGGRAPHGDGAGKLAVSDAVARLGGPFSAYAVVGLIFGLVTAFQVSGDQAVSGSAVLRDCAAVAAYVLVVCIALFAKNMPGIRSLFGRACPVIALILVAMPFVDSVGGAIFTSVIAAFNAFVSASMLFLLLEYSQTHRLPVRSAVAAVTLLSRIAVLVGLVAGEILGSQSGIDATVSGLIVALASIYLLMLISIVSFRTRRKAHGSDNVPLTLEEAETEVHDNPPDIDAATAPDDNDRRGEERYEDRARELGERYRLTQREQAILLPLARGRSAAYIADDLGLATSTVRSYTKSLYAKLDIHSKQDLIDLFAADRSNE